MNSRNAHVGAQSRDYRYAPAETAPNFAPFKQRINENTNAPICFYDKSKGYYEFTNFSPHPVKYKGNIYPTSEHLYQAFKFMNKYPEIAEHVRTCGNQPRSAFNEAHRYQKQVRPDWERVHVEMMSLAIKLKFTQHEDLRQLLLNTGNVMLVEDSPYDYFWGVGANNSGQNQLGKALMRLRNELRRNQGQNYNTRTPYYGQYESLRSSGTTQQALLSSRPVGYKTLCMFCLQQPRRQGQAYCSIPCARAATTCIYCHNKPKFGMYQFCSRSCGRKYQRM